MFAFIRQRSTNHLTRPEGFDLDDPTVFNRCLKDTEGSVRHLGLRMLGDHAAADRVMAATAAAAHQHRFDAPVRHDFRTWALGFSGRLCLDLLADAPAIHSRAVDNAHSDEVGQGVDAQIAHRARLLLEHVDRLAPRDRLVVVLRSWERFSFAQLAEILGEPVDATRLRYHAARERLAELLAGTRPAQAQTPTRMPIDRVEAGSLS